jgi:GDP-mannose 6-dehydrogenase
MMSGILPSNRFHVEQSVDAVLASGKRRVGMIGLSFKTGTDDLRESPTVTLAEALLGKGLALRVYDPEVHLSRLLGANKRFIEQHLPHIGSLIEGELREVVDHSDVLVAAIADKRVLAELRERVREDQLLIDLVRVPEPEAWRCAVRGLCW